MGFIKSIQTTIGSQFDDSFKEIIKLDNKDKNLLIKKITTERGIITDKSRLFVEPGECAILVDNGAIKDIVTEPGMYFMDTSSPVLFQTDIFGALGKTILEGIKRIAYKGEVIQEQAVYFISLTEKIGQKFGTQTPIIYKDPEWGPIEIKANGEYAFKVKNPVALLTNITGTINEFHVSDLTESILPFIQSGIATEIANLKLSFDAITTKQAEIGKELIKNTSEKLESLGIEITKLVVTAIDVPDEVKKSMRERTSIKMKATSVNNEEADVYAKLNQAEAVKDLANNSNNAGATIMGMNMGQSFAANMQGSLNKPNTEEPKE